MNKVRYYDEVLLKLDLYEPEGDKERERPLIIFIHGGGFKRGDKSNVKIVELCEYFYNSWN